MSILNAFNKVEFLVEQFNSRADFRGALLDIQVISEYIWYITDVYALTQEQVEQCRYTVYSIIYERNPTNQSKSTLKLTVEGLPAKRQFVVVLNHGKAKLRLGLTTLQKAEDEKIFEIEFITPIGSLMLIFLVSRMEHTFQFLTNNDNLGPIPLFASKEFSEFPITTS
jgi:hypothetical protein